MIREFESDGEMDWVGDRHVWVWRNKKSVNPRFIAAVSPYTINISQITLAGSHSFIVNAPYDDVVAWWLAAINA